MATLEEKIAALTAEHNFKAEIETLFGNYKTLAYASTSRTDDFTVCFDFTKEVYPDLALHLKYITSTYPCTEETSLIGSNSTESFSGFRFSFQNGVHENKAFITYLSNRKRVRINLPVDFYSSDVKVKTTRNVSEFEHHYFTGMTLKKINEVRLNAFFMPMFKTIHFVGGTSETFPQCIEDKEDFEYIIFNGKAPGK